jgi:hypothetical protein
VSKLTPEQKAANKAAQKVRDRAFAARRREYRNQLDAAKSLAEKSEFASRRDIAGAALERERRNMLDAEDAILREIDELHEKLRRTKESFHLSIEPKKAVRDAAWQAFRDHEKSLVRAVEARYPDMCECWSVAGWNVPEDVRAQMDAARSEA